MPATANRRAVTLVEVLIAIFLMGIGLMAILSLFPLGASQMAQALKDQRCAEAGTNAAALARVLWRQTCDDDPNTGSSKFTVTRMAVVNGQQPAVPVQYPFSNQLFVAALDDPSYVPPPSKPPLTAPDYTSNAPLVPDPNLPNDPAAPTSYLSAMPIVPRTGAPNPTPLGPTNPPGPSYPVFVDPIGWQANAVNQNSANGTRQHQAWLPTVPVQTNGSQINNGVRTWRIPRRTLYVRDTSVPSTGPNTQPWIPLGSAGTARVNNNPTPEAVALGSPQRIFRLFSLMDDMTFNYNGTPDLDGDPRTAEAATAASTRKLDRQGRYSWAYLLRRRNNADRTNVDVSVVVYSGRSIDVPSAETAYQAAGVTGTKSLTLIYGTAASPNKPALRRGQWVLDASLWDLAGNLAPQGIFYRVVNVDDSVANQLALELQTPLLGGPFDPNNPNTPMRSIIVMDNVVEVFTRTGVTHVAPPLPY